MKNLFIGIASLALAACAASPQAPGNAQVVKITPLGSHDGEFCPLDRALIFEDPDGIRLEIYAPRGAEEAEAPIAGAPSCGFF